MRTVPCRPAFPLERGRSVGRLLRSVFVGVENRGQYSEDETILFLILPLPNDTGFIGLLDADLVRR